MGPSFAHGTLWEWALDVFPQLPGAASPGLYFLKLYLSLNVLSLDSYGLSRQGILGPYY